MNCGYSRSPFSKLSSFEELIFPRIPGINLRILSITTKAATQAQTEPVKGQQIAVDPLSPEELKQMLSQSQNSEDDDCLMCGS